VLPHFRPVETHPPPPLPKTLFNACAPKDRLSAALFGYGLVRIAGAASGVWWTYVADLATTAPRGRGAGRNVGGGVVSAKLLSALPLGIAADYIPRRILVSSGALLGAAATQLFGMSGQVSSSSSAGR